ncbi:MAG: HAD family hydrolase [Bacteroidota bacterium]
MDRIKVIAFDADDTLWMNEPLFNKVHEQYAELLSHYMPPEELADKLYGAELRNLKIFGYGAKGFMLSLIETAIEVTEEKISAIEIQRIIDWGKELVEHPIHLLEGVEEVLESVHHDYQLMVLTKGELFHQETKIARSGLSRYFQHVEIVSEKNEATYEEILNRYRIQKEEFLMIGNSLKSDVLPVVNIGAKAIHVPYHTTWHHEMVDDKHIENKDYLELGNIRDLLNLLRGA